MDDAIQIGGSTTVKAALDKVQLKTQAFIKAKFEQLVQNSIKAYFLKRVAAIAKELKPGDPLELKTIWLKLSPAK